MSHEMCSIRVQYRTKTMPTDSRSCCSDGVDEMCVPSASTSDDTGATKEVETTTANATAPEGGGEVMTKAPPTDKPFRVRGDDEKSDDADENSEGGLATYGQLFRFATPFDWFCVVCGAIGSGAVGACQPGIATTTTRALSLHPHIHTIP